MISADIGSLRFLDDEQSSLSNIHISIRPGEFILLLGPSESGKSVLCRCLAGIIPAFQSAQLNGKIRINDRTTANQTLPESSRFVSLVTDDPQNQLFLPALKDDLAFGPCNLRFAPGIVGKRIKKAFRFVSLQGFEERRPEELSGGEAERAVIASFLTMEAPVLILDRAMDQMDMGSRCGLFRRLKDQCRNSGKIVILVDEKPGETFQFADRVLFLNKGRLIFDGPPKRIPRSCMKHIQFFQPPRSIDTGEFLATKKTSPAIEAKHLYYSYPDSDFELKNLSLVIHKGEFISISGPNGAGKTTLVKHFIGLKVPEKGDVLVEGRNTKDLPPAKLSNKVGFLFQNPESQIFADSILKEVSFSLKTRKWPPEKIRGCVERVLDSLGILDYADEHPYRLSRSLMQKVALASCLVHEPEVLILDEPVSHMSYPQNVEMLRLIEMLHSKGKTIIMITHDPLVAAHFSTRAITMENGRITRDTTESHCRSIAKSFLNASQDALQ